jgi:hypothetical protein
MAEDQFTVETLLQSIGRCPRCGYVLRYDGYRYTCDFCGFPHTRRTLKETIIDLEKTLSNKVLNFIEAGRKTAVQRFITYPPTPTQGVCAVCGLVFPLGIPTCPRCGARFAAAQTNTSRPPGTPDVGDQKILDYIVARDGTISLSQASTELSLPMEALQQAIERLKTEGFLNQK